MLLLPILVRVELLLVPNLLLLLIVDLLAILRLFKLLEMVLLEVLLVLTELLRLITFGEFPILPYAAPLLVELNAIARFL